jgi:hypothetical protein
MMVTAKFLCQQDSSHLAGTGEYGSVADSEEEPVYV